MRPEQMPGPESSRAARLHRVIPFGRAPGRTGIPAASASGCSVRRPLRCSDRRADDPDADNGRRGVLRRRSRNIQRPKATSTSMTRWTKA